MSSQITQAQLFYTKYKMYSALLGIVIDNIILLFRMRAIDALYTASCAILGCISAVRVRHNVIIGDRCCTDHAWGKLYACKIYSIWSFVNVQYYSQYESIHIVL